MRCPFCAAEGNRRQVHAHLIARHPERVDVRSRDPDAALLVVACPMCAQELSVPLHPRHADPALRAEIEAAARMVLFDQLLYHLQGEHAGRE